MGKIITHKSITIIIIAAALVIITGLSIFLGIFFYRRNDPQIRYASAEARWEKAEEKKATDAMQFEIKFGSGDDAMAILANVSGERYYNGNNADFNYEIILTYLGLTALGLTLQMHSDGITHSFSVEKSEGVIDFETSTFALTKEEADSYIELDISKNIVYDTKAIAIDKEGNYSIDGDASLYSLLLRASDLIKSENANMDLFAMLERWINFGRVKGQIQYDKKLNFADISSNQEISAFMTWQEFDGLIADIGDIPENIMQIINDRKLIIEDIPILGDYTIDFNEVFAGGIAVNVEITNASTYQIIKK